MRATSESQTQAGGVEHAPLRAYRGGSEQQRCLDVVPVRWSAEEDLCFNEPVSEAIIRVRRRDYPEIPESTTTTDGDGNYGLYGPFGHSTIIGAPTIIITQENGLRKGRHEAPEHSKEVMVHGTDAQVNFYYSDQVLG